MSIHVRACLHNGVTEYHLRYPGMSLPEAQAIADKINAGALNSRGRPTQADEETLDTSCKDYDLLERKHKQDAWTDDQQRHFEAGWEAAVRHYFG